MTLNTDGALKLRWEQEFLCMGKAADITLFAWKETNARQLKRHRTARQSDHVWKKLLQYCNQIIHGRNKHLRLLAQLLPQCAASSSYYCKNFYCPFI